MRIITLNMDMFRLQIDNSLDCFLKEYEPDVAIIQESKGNENIYHNPIKPNQFEGRIDKRIYSVMAFCKNMIWDRIDLGDLKKYNCRFVAIKTKKNKQPPFSALGVHIPADNDEIENLMDEIVMDEYNIICGDFNASSQKPESINYIKLKKLIEVNKYSNLWEQGLKESKANYIDYKGTKQKARSNVRTYVGNRHIDYILGKEINLTEITIDMRTLAFTDHCAIIIDCEKVNIAK